jgi:hypothetical protein
LLGETVSVQRSIGAEVIVRCIVLFQPDGRKMAERSVYEHDG